MTEKAEKKDDDQEVVKSFVEMFSELTPEQQRAKIAAADKMLMNLDIPEGDDPKVSIKELRSDIAAAIEEAEKEEAEREERERLLEKQRTGAYIQTFSGLKFYPFDARPEDVNIMDIAHSIALQCRYSGHCREFYSVAQHSVIMSYLVTPKNALEALMHDSTEAYVSDVARPIKKQLDAFENLETEIWAVIARRFRLNQVMSDEVQTMDRVICRWEYERFLNPIVGEDEYWPPYGLTTDFPFDPQPVIDEHMSAGWSPEEAKNRFLSRFHELYGAHHRKVGSYGAAETKGS